MDNNFEEVITELSRKSTIRLNNLFISSELIISILKDARRRAINDKKSEYEFYVQSSHDTLKKLSRSKEEYLDLLDYILNNEINAYLLISLCVIVEDYISNILRLIFRKNPILLVYDIRGEKVDSKIEIETIVTSKNFEDVIDTIIEKKIAQLLFRSPSKLLRYLEDCIRIGIDDTTKNEYIEIKATRDLLVHSDGIINKIYLRKVGNDSRGNINEKISIDKKYIERSLSVCKRLVRIIKTNSLRILNE